MDWWCIKYFLWFELDCTCFRDQTKPGKSGIHPSDAIRKSDFCRRIAANFVVKHSVHRWQYLTFASCIGQNLHTFFSQVFPTNCMNLYISIYEKNEKWKVEKTMELCWSNVTNSANLMSAFLFLSTLLGEGIHSEYCGPSNPALLRFQWQDISAEKDIYQRLISCFGIIKT